MCVYSKNIILVLELFFSPNFQDNANYFELIEVIKKGKVTLNTHTMKLV